MRLAKEVIPSGIFLSVLAVLSYFIHPLLFYAVLALLALVLFFFRNPRRVIETHDHHILAPADGRVQGIVYFQEDEFFRAGVVKISIFLSVFNVHINRSPIQGEIIYAAYRPGQYLPAFKSHASDLNERNTIGLENKKIKVLVHQITGFVARRIVCYKNKGDFLQQGEIFGMIKFGSCTEIILPENVEILIKEGDKVTAGKTILGVIKDHQDQGI